jgi:4-hydroxybenzoate polyprenyltransferase
MATVEKVKNKIAIWGSLVSFSHSIFALPFAVFMIGVVHLRYPVTLLQVCLLVVCVVAARTAAMAFNRVVDAEIDSSNPRTREREVPTGKVSTREGWILVISSSALFLYGSYLLGTHCVVLAPFVLALLLSYSFFKRFSALCHLVLGFALACAPGGVWYALTGEFSWEPIPLMGAVLFWVAGFDILYSLQDESFDAKTGLHSIPVALGSKKARVLSVVFHVVSTVLLALSGMFFNLGIGFWIGFTLFSVTIALQHVDVARHGVACIGKAFFTRNGFASVALCFLTLVDIYII